MLGERSEQRGLWEADRLYLDHVGKDTFYGLLASQRGRLFRDADFAEFYCADNGRDSVPPSLLATALLLQTHDKVSDAEAKARADFDLRWKVALGIEVEDRPFAKSTLQVFRAQLILHDRVREVFESSLRLARESGYLKKRSMKVALDTTNILGRGAVRDTFNLLADGIVKLMRALAAVEKSSVKEWGKGRGYEGYLGSSVKGEAAIDWSDKGARQALLAGIVGDADRLLELSRRAQGELPEDSAERQQIVDAAELLGQLLLQDIERKSGDGDDGGDDGVSLKDGVSRDRMMSVHDPEMRHGHKSSSKRFDGHKAAIVVDTDTQLITARGGTAGQRSGQPGGAGTGGTERGQHRCTGAGGHGRRRLWRRSYQADLRRCGPQAGSPGAGPARPEALSPRMTLSSTWRRAVAPVRRGRSPTPSCRRESGLMARGGSTTCGPSSSTGRYVEYVHCGPSASQPKAGRDGGVLIHPQEGMLQEARALQRSAAYDEYRARRVAVEHRLARLVQLGIRQSRYFGRVKTRFQLYLAATVANLTLVAGKIDLSDSVGGELPRHRAVLSAVPSDVQAVSHDVVAHATAIFGAVRLGQLWSKILFASALLPKSLSPTRAFRPGF